jgi:hypothetical protein
MENKTGVPRPRPLALGGDNGDEDTVPAANAYVQTKNEIIDVAINIPDLDEVGIDEELEKVGEVLSATGDVVIIKSLPSEFASGGSERTLDSDTLLVFGDRKVMGYVRFIVFPSLILFDATLARYTKLLALPPNPYIKSCLTRNTPSFKTMFRSAVKFFTFLAEAVLSL